jgi:hypothetical protein
MIPMKAIFFFGRPVVTGMVWLGLLTGANFSQAATSVARTDAEEDMRQFFSTLQRVHPDLLAKVTMEDYLKLKQQTRMEVLAKADPKGQVRVVDLAYALYYAAAFFHDGHTSVQSTFPDLDESNTRFPGFLLNYADGAFVVTAARKRAMEGMELLAVNGKPVREFLQPVLDRCSGETEVSKADGFTRSQCFWYNFSHLCGSAGSLTLKLRDAEGKESEQQVETLSAPEFRKLVPAVGNGAPDPRPGTWVEFLDADRIAHFIYPSFIPSDPEKKKVDAIFREIKDRKSRDLIIDLRGNGGGNSEMGNYIISYLYAGKFCAFSKMRVKLSRDLLSSPDWKEAPEEYRSPDLEGMVITAFETEAPASKPDAFFSGRVYLLVDGGTFSSASDFATMFRDYRVGTILGSETGGLPVSFGECFGFALDHSGIRCSVSCKQFFGPRPRPGDDEHGVLPDIPATGKELRAYRGEADPVLAFTVNHIKQTRDGR